MTNHEILQTVAATIREIFGVGDIDINSETVSDDIPGWDSLSHTVLIATIEQTFDVELTSTTSFKNVGELVSLLSKQLFPQSSFQGNSPSSIPSSIQGHHSPLSSSDKQFSDLQTKDSEIHIGRFVYPCRLKLTPGARYLSVQLHGSINRKARDLPVFARWNWGKLLNAHVLAISDPTLTLDDTMDLGWYLGVKDESALAGVVSIARRCAENIGISAERIIFSGGSGGGFSALQAAALAPNGKAIAINPQTDLLKHTIKKYVEKVSGCASIEEAADVFAERWDAIVSLRNAVLRGSSPKVVYVQNINDTPHFKEHFTPFAEAFGLSLTDKNSTNGNFMSILYDGPEDHVAETSNEVKRINAEAIPFLLDFDIEDTVPELFAEIHLAEDRINVSVKVVDGNDSDYQFACYLFKNHKVIEKIYYQTDQKFTFRTGEPGKYMGRCFARNKKQMTFSRYTKIIKVGG